MYLCFSSPLTQKSPKTFSHQLLSAVSLWITRQHFVSVNMRHFCIFTLSFICYRLFWGGREKDLNVEIRQKKKTITECKWKCILFFHLLGVFQVIFSSFKVFKLSTHSAGWGSVYHQEGSRAALNHVFCMMTVFVFKNTNFCVCVFLLKKRNNRNEQEMFCFHEY